MQQRDTEDRGPQGAEGRPLRLSNFDRLKGVSFPVESNGALHDLVLVRTEELQGSPREAGGFRLEFLGPPDPILPQGIYAFSVQEERHEVFIVPIGPGRDAGLLYEAVFF